MAPLDGLRVVDLTRVVAGPFCTMMLGDMGADVVKIEEPRHGDDSRGWGPFVHGCGAFFFELNRSKRSVALDLKSSDGAAALRRLIVDADVLIENFRPGSLAELGFDYTAASAINPRLIYCSIAGYGHGAGRPGVGFQAEVIGLADTATGFQGRSVWTDERGDQVYSELQGEGTAARNRVTGTILSGTGRYAGLTGSYDFSWQWVMEGEEGAVQGRAVDLRGRVQRGPAAGEPQR